ncbi:MAG TPA: GDSL-type esterase/lipase family protein [Ktedonobacteraceae bacterium]
MARKQGWYVLRMVLLWVTLLACIPVIASHAFGAGRFSRAQPAPVGPKAYYLALGDSLAFGYQPNWNWAGGYASDFARDLTTRGTRNYVNLGCPDENSFTMINGGCPYELLHKSVYLGPQLDAAVNFLRAHAGQVSPVTLDIGVNDLIPDLNGATCTINPKWTSDLALAMNNFKNVILSRLIAAMTVNGQMTGDLILLNYYDPYQDKCPNTVADIQVLNQGLATAAAGRATMVDVFSAFAAPVNAVAALSAPLVAAAVTPVSSTRPDPAPVNAPAPVPASNICAYTWMCSSFRDVHPNSTGYSVIASTIEHTVNY